MSAMTRIAFQRTGGVIGQVMDLRLDLDKLPKEEAKHLESLIGNADFFRLPENLIALSTSEEFQYTLTIHERLVQHTVRVTDTSAPGKLRKLIDELATLAVINMHGLL